MYLNFCLLGPAEIDSRLHRNKPRSHVIPSSFPQGRNPHGHTPDVHWLTSSLNDQSISRISLNTFSP